ncbi:hypothetical protein U1Q18_024501, partial [Sarracenia purpurea var. burkii]
MHEESKVQESVVGEDKEVDESEKANLVNLEKCPVMGREARDVGIVSKGSVYNLFDVLPQSNTEKLIGQPTKHLEDLHDKVHAASMGHLLADPNSPKSWANIVTNDK